MTPIRPFDSYAARGPFDDREVGLRMDRQRIALSLTIRDICGPLDWPPSTWHSKAAAKDIARGWTNRFSVRDISACIAVMQELRPDWTPPAGFPFGVFACAGAKGRGPRRTRPAAGKHRGSKKVRFRSIRRQSGALRGPRTTQ